MREKIKESQLSSIKNHKGSRIIDFDIGNNVFVRDYTNPNKASWQEATVKKRIGPQSYRCLLTRNKKTIKRHVNQMIRGTQNGMDDNQIAKESEQVDSREATELEAAEVSSGGEESGQKSVSSKKNEVRARNLRGLERVNYKE